MNKEEGWKIMEQNQNRLSVGFWYKMMGSWPRPDGFSVCTTRTWEEDESAEETAMLQDDC